MIHLDLCLHVCTGGLRHFLCRSCKSAISDVVFAEFNRSPIRLDKSLVQVAVGSSGLELG